MKSLSMVLALGLISTPAFAQSPGRTPVPTPVQEQFDLLYPEARKIRWSAQEGVYAAHFRNQKHKTIIVLDEGGAVKRIEADIRVTALPKKASTYLMEEANAKRIRQATIIAPENGEILYQADVSAVGEFVFNSDGELIGRKDRH
jgi:hypothetical protein